MIQLNNPSYYNNRELSWLAFNERVLQEALDPRNPLLEKLKFLAIFSSNLDEFFMVRVAGLQDQVKVGFNKPENKAGMTPKQQLHEIALKNHQLVNLQYDTLRKILYPKLQKEHVHFLKVRDLNDSQREALETYFDEHIFPVLTPMAIDAYRPFPMLLNKSINLAVVLEDTAKEVDSEQRTRTAIVQLPAMLERFVQLPENGGLRKLLLLDDVIGFFIGKLFHGYEVKSTTAFRITRNADMTIHEEGARDLLKEIEEELRKRKWGLLSGSKCRKMAWILPFWTI